MSQKQQLAAGRFSSWLRKFRKAQADGADMDVPCGDCTACCRSSYFIHIKPEETETLARIPKALLFPAPGLPNGSMLMGYDENGHCPMLVDHRCTIYEYRPQTCRTYDCRVFPATGIALDAGEKALIIARTQQWKFEYRNAHDRQEHAAVTAAAEFLGARADDFPDGFLPTNLPQLALLAIKVSDVFLTDINRTTGNRLENLDREIVKAIVKADASFQPRCGSSKSEA